MLVPGCQPHTSLSLTNSSGVAKFGGVGRPSPSTWVTTFAVENPSPPAAIASDSSARIASNSSGVASRADASAPITARRIAEWPTMKPMLSPSGSDSTMSRNSGNVRHANVTPAVSASTGIASTRASSRVKKSSSPGCTGARVSPQFPATTVVTPCSGEGDSAWSQKTCAS